MNDVQKVCSVVLLDGTRQAHQLGPCRQFGLLDGRWPFLETGLLFRRAFFPPVRGGVLLAQ